MAGGTVPNRFIRSLCDESTKRTCHIGRIDEDLRGFQGGIATLRVSARQVLPLSFGFSLQTFRELQNPTIWLKSGFCESGRGPIIR